MTMTNTIYTDHSDFISNKYSEWYYSIISNAQLKSRKRGIEYFENHHILPRSIFPEFIDEKWNQILLTAKEHVICHHLLTKFVIRESLYKMSKAYHLLHTTTHVNTNSRSYEHNKKIFIESISGVNSKVPKGKEHYNYGKKRSQETRDKISKANRGNICGKNHPMYGTTWSNETREKMKNRIYPKGEHSTKFKGWYITPEGKFSTGDCLYPEVHKSALIKWCKNPDKIITKRMITNSKYLQKINAKIGQTFSKIGFGFESI